LDASGPDAADDEGLESLLDDLDELTDEEARALLEGEGGA
jgi:hypothetical protein